MAYGLKACSCHPLSVIPKKKYEKKQNKTKQNKTSNHEQTFNSNLNNYVY